MKKMLFIIASIVMLVSCSKDDDDVSNSGLENTYNTLKSGIVGTWIMDGYQGVGRIGNPYISTGWNEDMTYWVDHYNYKLVFSNDGKVTDNRGDTFSYSVYMDKEKEVYYGEDNSDYYWPFKKGVVVLKIDNGYGNNYAEIKKDGKLYIYNASLGIDGEPKFRFKKQ